MSTNSILSIIGAAYPTDFAVSLPRGACYLFARRPREICRPDLYFVVQQHQEHNLQNLVQTKGSCPTGHANIVIALQYVRDAQRQLNRLEEQLADQLTERAP